jgi:glycosyltransferase involved in cell wall biosynthesis
MMRIVLIGTTACCVLGFRGSLIKELAAKGYKVYAFAIDYSDEQKQLLKSLGVIAIDYDLSRSGLNMLTDLKMMLQLKAKLEVIKPDIVLSYFVKPVIYGTVAARLANIPIRIAMLEGLGYVHTASQNGYGFKKRILQIIQGVLFTISFKFASKVVFLNPDDPNDLSKMTLFSKSKVEVLGGIGVELLEYPYSKPNMNNPIRFIFVARLLAEKGIYQLIEAIKLVQEKYPSTELVVLGDLDEDNPGSLTKKSLDNLIKQEIIIYPGQVVNVNEWLSDSHIFVLPSYREGVPISTQEAMAVGLPIITTDVPGCRETVVDGENGFLVPAFDVEKLAEKMIFFVEHPAQIEPMGFASRRMAEEKFDVHKVNANMLEIMGLK